MARIMPMLHVVMPVYNEEHTLEPCLARVFDVALPEGWHCRVIVVDDGSDDAHTATVQQVVNDSIARQRAVQLIRHDTNRGKGAALQTGFDAILGDAPEDDDLVVIQDADLEYDPRDFLPLMQPILDGRADATIGTRWGAHRQNVGFKRKVHAMGNAMLTWLSNRLTGYRLLDMECCYKMLTISLLRRLRPMLTEPRFGIEPQMVASMRRLGVNLAQVPVQYDPRGVAAGKKIGWTDGVRALVVITRERLRGNRANPDQS